MADGFGGAMVPTGGSQSQGMNFNIGLQQASNQANNSQQAVNQSQSDSFIPDYVQTPLMMEIAKYAETMAPQVYQWGLDQFNRNQGNIDALMRAGQTWASPQHIATQMGAAEAGVQQAGAQALESSKRDLQSYGIDPGAGRYAALDQASRVATAAAAAGAGNQQRNADIAQGLTMQNQAMSAGLQNTQIGYGAAQNMNALLGTAMQLKYSPLGTHATSSGASSGMGASSGQSSGMNLGMGQQESTSFQQQPVNVMKNVGVMVKKGGYIDDDDVEEPPEDPITKDIKTKAGSESAGEKSAGETYGLKSDFQMGGPVQRRQKAPRKMKRQKMPKPQRSRPPQDEAQDQEDQEPAADQGYGAPPSLNRPTPALSNPPPAPEAPGLPTDDTEEAPGYRRGGRVQTHFVPAAGGTVDVGADIASRDQMMQQRMAMQGVRPETIGVQPSVDVGTGQIDPMTGQRNIPASSGVVGNWDPMLRQRDISGYAIGGVVGTNTSGFTPAVASPAGVMPGPPTQAFDKGGDVTTGGFVSHAMSPSNGKQVDDVPARLNEGEYVIPRDVVHWKGKDFFHKLIAASRKHRAMQGAPDDDRGYQMGGPVSSTMAPAVQAVSAGQPGTNIAAMDRAIAAGDYLMQQYGPSPQQRTAAVQMANRAQAGAGTSAGMSAGMNARRFNLGGAI